MNTSEYSIIVQGLTKKFGHTNAISHLGFTIERGEIIGFLGPNGAGKSTTLRILSGILPATAGSVFIHGTSLAREPQKVRSIISFLPENNPLPDDLRPIEYLRFRAHLKNIPPKEHKKQIDHVLATCNITRSNQKHLIRNLSKGTKQRIGIADCLLGSPSIIIMDEPTIGLDPHQIISIRELIQSLKGKSTVILSSHILSEIEACCDRVIILNHGHIVAQGKKQALAQEFLPFQQYRIRLNVTKDELASALSGLAPHLKIEFSALPTPHFILQTPHDFPLPHLIFTELLPIYPHWQLQEITLIEPTLEQIFIACTRPAWKATLTTSPRQKII